MIGEKFGHRRIRRFHRVNNNRNTRHNLPPNLVYPMRFNRLNSDKIEKAHYLSIINVFSWDVFSGITSKTILSSGFLLSTIGDSWSASSSAEASLLLLSA